MGIHGYSYTKKVFSSIQGLLYYYYYYLDLQYVPIYKALLDWLDPDPAVRIKKGKHKSSLFSALGVLFERGE